VNSNVFAFCLDRVLNFVFPVRCVSCRKMGELLCDVCLGSLEPVEDFRCIVCGRPAVGGFTHPSCNTKYAPERALAAFRYSGTAKAAVKALKYKGVRELSKSITWLMLEDLAEKGVSFGSEAVLVPLPISFWRRGERGFNQAQLIAEALGEKLGLEIYKDALRKINDTPSQTGLDRKRRTANVRGAFAVGSESVRGKDVLLVDDVLTTGATVREAAKVLKKSSCGQVWVLTFARD
jgi:competence protein ComFC